MDVYYREKNNGKRYRYRKYLTDPTQLGFTHAKSSISSYLKTSALVRNKRPDAVVSYTDMDTAGKQRIEEVKPIETLRSDRRLVMSLDHLHPVESFLWSTIGLPFTDNELLDWLDWQGLSVRNHPAYEMVMECPQRDKYIVCKHRAHDTLAKKEACIRRQAERMALRTIRSHLEILQQFEQWTASGSTVTHAMWACIEREGEQSCDLCRSHQGVVYRVEVPLVVVMHPGCNCIPIQLPSPKVGMYNV